MNRSARRGCGRSNWPATEAPPRGLVRQAVDEILPPQTRGRKPRRRAGGGDTVGAKPLDAALETVKNLRYFICNGNRPESTLPLVGMIEKCLEGLKSTERP